MGNDGTGRRSPWDLFAERQVHMRSGDESRYVVLSRPLQIGVAAGFLAILGLLATASYNAIAKHLELAAQQRALAEQQAASAAQADRSAGELTALRQQNEAARREIEQLTAALDQAQAERMEAVTASSAAGATAAELEGALVATTQESQRLAAELAETRASGDSRPGPGPTPGSADTQDLLAEVTGLRAELERVNREAAALRRTATQARQALAAFQGGGEVSALPQGPARTQAADAATAARAHGRARLRRGSPVATGPGGRAGDRRHAEHRSRGPQRDRGRRGHRCGCRAGHARGADRERAPAGGAARRQPCPAAGIGRRRPARCPAGCPGQCSTPALAASAPLTRSARATGSAPDARSRRRR